jgi:para-aminobenzoate synthetase/4-amino-4-deoxychorismate lyase
MIDGVRFIAPAAQSAACILGEVSRGCARVFCERLDGPAEPLVAARWLRGEPGAVALSGDWADGGLILTSDPLRVADPALDDPFALLDAGAPFEVEPCEGPVIGGGWFGWLGFELARAIEELPPPPPRPQPMPAFQLAFHDHLVRRSTGGEWFFEALWTEERDAVLRERLRVWRKRLATPERSWPAARPAGAGPLRAQAPGAAGHAVAVAEAIARIAAGDMSQVNVCMRFDGELEGDPLDLWVAGVQAAGPAHAAYLAGDGYAVASLSPELFLRRRGRHVECKPIKGTAPIDTDPALLAASAKDRAENLMIVDLMRNDLGRVCEYGSVRATTLCAIEPAAGVWHLVSTVEGTLRRDVADGRLLRATFPPGSVTGAPKVQAMQTIHRLEPTAREVFCGAIGYASPRAGLELSVAIRTLEVRGARLWLQAGGGIVSDSSPAGELAEAIAKARGAATAAGLAVDSRPPPPVSAPVAPIATLPRPERGSGVFETLRVSGGRAPAGREHLRRLESSCAELGIALPGDLAARVDAVAADLRSGALRIDATDGGVALTTRSLPPPSPTALVPVVLPGGLGRHKWTDRRLIDGLSAPGATPLLCDLDGEIQEAGYAAILLVRDGTVLAPPIDRRRLDSISRRAVLDGAAARGIPVVAARVTLSDALAADAIVLTSSLRGPHPGLLEGGPPAAASAAACVLLAAEEG